MAIDTPARIAILGAGPIGIEVALYARFLGYDVDLYERGRAAENMLRWGHVRLFTPWRMNVSPLGLAALTAQDAAWRPAEDEALLTGRELVERYFLPLATSDLVIDGLHERCEVLAVGKEDLLKHELAGDEARSDEPFRLIVRDQSGSERAAAADVVIDASGTFGHARWLGRGGIPAIGELAAAERIERGLPDVLGADRERYAGRHTLVVGSGFSAGTTVVALAELAQQAAATRITWVTRRELPAGAEGPIRRIAHDALVERDRLAERANQLAAAGGDVVHLPCTSVERIARVGDGPLAITLAGQHAGALHVDQIVANVGYRPDHSLSAELQVHECYASGGPMKLAAALAANQSGDCLTQASHGAATLVTTEPNFYILGAKSYGRDSRFLLLVGREQIRDLFALIGDRADLDLYRTVACTLR